MSEGNTPIAIKTIPGIGELLEGKVLSSQIREVALLDLLGREPVTLEENRIRDRLSQRSVMITGAGGSIGSELCRQIATFGPKQLVAFERAESDLFRIDLELRRLFPTLKIAAEIGDVRDAQRVDDLIKKYRIQAIYHAAAYKHVPMMEAHVVEAIHNNIIGTWNVVEAAQRNRVQNFVMISTDKAVNPTNVMGATKRVAELVVASMPALGIEAVSVRFGNVLGSNGSVLPVFKEQIARGGPVTVTHPEVRRYFMTVREAVQLVLQASTMGKGNEIFVLDMGEPVRILDMANNLIRLAGLVPGEDIEIRYTGLRPGEKLFEELATQGEDILPTYHEKVKIFQGYNIALDALLRWRKELDSLMAQRDDEGIIAHLRELVPEYSPARLTPRLGKVSNARAASVR